MKEKRTFIATFVFYLAILRHSVAHFLHVWAHCLQCSIVWCFSHSTPQASHTSAQTLQICFAYSLSLDMNWEAVTQILAQSRHSCIHFDIIFTSSSRRDSVAQNSHAPKQSLHESMQLSYFVFCRAFDMLLYWEILGSLKCNPTFNGYIDSLVRYLWAFHLWIFWISGIKKVHPQFPFASVYFISCLLF